MKLKNLIYNFLLLLFSSLVALVLVEIYLRLNNQGPWGTLDSERNDPTINIADEKLGWTPTYALQELVDEMMESDLNLMQKKQYLKDGGFAIKNYFE